MTHSFKTKPALFALIGVLAAPLALTACGEKSGGEGGGEASASAGGEGASAAAAGPVTTTTGGVANTTNYPDGSQTQSVIQPDGSTTTTVSGPLAEQAKAVEEGDTSAAPTTSTSGAATAPANP
jgi:hypothetical protein